MSRKSPLNEGARFNFRGPSARQYSTADEHHSTKWLTNVRDSAILNRMVDDRLDVTFQALADPTRRGMLASLALGEKSIGELGEPYAMSFAGAAKHVKVLESAGLIARRKAGRKQICTLRAEPLAEAERWLKQWETFWTVRLDRLQAMIEADKKEKPDG